MAQKLLSSTLTKTLHIALFLLIAMFGLQAYGQSVLLPGDVVVVSVDTDTPSIDFIPLIDIERGTTIFFSDGRWNDSLEVLNGNEIKFTFEESITAGTSLHIDNAGGLNFERGAHHLFVYQKEQKAHRFIFGMGWGKGNIWNTKDGSDIPLSLKENPGTILTLGEEPNQQYYIRNGASGTRSMLLSFVGEPLNWRGNEGNSFQIFGTSFNLMKSPVVQFKNSISSVSESDSVAILNIAIYEHDGARASVDVVFDSLRSIASPDHFSGFDSKTINFTGLIGDYNYQMKIPISANNNSYDGFKAGIFKLQNLTYGDFGDFSSHNLIIEDDEQPEIFISKVSNGADRAGSVEIKNSEQALVSIEGWTLSAKDLVFKFDSDAVLMPGESIQWFDTAELPSATVNEHVVSSNLKKRLLDNGGGILTLKNSDGKIIHQVSYSKIRSAESGQTKNAELFVNNYTDMGAEEVSGNLNKNVTTAMGLVNSGWRVLPNWSDIKEEFSDKDFYTWNEKQQSFQKLNENSTVDETNSVIFGHFEENEIEQLTNRTEQLLKKQASDDNLTFTVSGTDRNENQVLDGLEGLNLVYNTLDKGIRIENFLNVAKSEYPELPLGSAIYEINQSASGELNFRQLENDQIIPPKTSFWVMLEYPYAKTKLSLGKDEFNDGIDLSNNLSNKEDIDGVLELTLQSGAQEEVVKVNFSDEKVLTRSKDLSSYPELFLPDQSFLNFSFKQGSDYYDLITLSSESEQRIELPIHFSSSESGQITFSVTEWDQLPADWEVILQDLKTNKEYTLRRDFSVTLEHVFTTSKVNKEIREIFSVDQNRDEERFAVTLVPPQSKAVKDETITDKPRELELHQNYPNPFNPVTTISFYLPQPEDVKLSVFNIVGQPVAVIVEGTLSAGQKQFEWDATDKPSGMYIYQLEVGKTIMTRKMTLVK
ncbi:MAG TPA: T9SS type A sorting domain-containing protein [Gracilimonas sp.]|uniref:T9SS type A sorting domain-containing protein n=1 Tax=Gracilimonas sp. TaxID=1974203 RepID=UPI002D8E428E|nr:T9SS type A sorting domain-containing protein [Gracilimonas sp.]